MQKEDSQCCIGLTVFYSSETWMYWRVQQRATKMVQGLECLSCEAETWDCSAWRRGGSGESHPWPQIPRWRMQKRQSFLQWCPVPGAEIVGTTWAVQRRWLPCGLLTRSLLLSGSISACCLTKPVPSEEESNKAFKILLEVILWFVEYARRALRVTKN